ncbi:hypothetical protein K402DRAFT_102151 [Aulographum hederae CBS 113979]|uniref:Uncharacterized protein n=1 Tax=Aulographum hederae CBS 113979 TaxID=1176131 RepID=A0A6G1GY16_9PEZI|nr:hypothetical protein K402DRAFT_102151 [Aulographum hederae CBS 113979]
MEHQVDAAAKSCDGRSLLTVTHVPLGRDCESLLWETRDGRQASLASGSLHGSIKFPFPGPFSQIDAHVRGCHCLHHSTSTSKPATEPSTTSWRPLPPEVVQSEPTAHSTTRMTHHDGQGPAKRNVHLAAGTGRISRHAASVASRFQKVRRSARHQSFSQTPSSPSNCEASNYRPGRLARRGRSVVVARQKFKAPWAVDASDTADDVAVEPYASVEAPFAASQSRPVVALRQQGRNCE